MIFILDWLSTKFIQYLLLNLAHLKHFELHAAKGAVYLANGTMWENITGSLNTFNFIFYAKLVEVEKTLDTFRSQFWLEKRWFVAYEYDCLFSVPRFSKRDCNVNFQRPIYSTAIDDKIFLDKITILELSEPLIGMKHRFAHVRTLKVNCIVQMETLSSIIDVNRIEHLILSCPALHSLPIMSQLLKMKCLQKLSIITNPFELLIQLREMQFGNIRTLNIDYNFVLVKRYSFKQLFYIFPCVERLHMKSISKANMICMINGFKHLSNASFSLDSLSEIDERNWVAQPGLALDGAWRLTSDNYTCRYEHSHLDVWISKQVSQFHL
ncbi:unnamed protein product [Rotaria magnacalcarata]|uniref:Uncharacterized protein n=1 Tax=Rotaria magnacalcarata TaxID=392030 RepID=A0A816T1X0_9BILA|nr:unnamed protein product [Rotaria magnacalcarata]